jgi:hypothetical protein
VARMKNLIFALLISTPLAFPLYSIAEPKEPDLIFLTDWKPLPDRTMILRFGGDLYRHHILASSPKSECNGVTVSNNGEITLIARTVGQAWSYIISPFPVFYSDDGKVWIFIPKEKISD